MLSSTTRTSSEVVGSIDDLLLEIFLRLPVKSLMRFKIVSTKWKSLITSPRFEIQYSRPLTPVIGMFCPMRKSSTYEYIHLNDKNPTKPPFKEFDFPDDRYPFWIQQSCNGLLLCCSSGIFSLCCARVRSPVRRCYVLNPTTNCFTKVPRPGVTDGVPRIVHGVTMVFDPAKSAVPYKLVCVRGSEYAHDLYQIEIYSSKYGEWSLSGKPFMADANFNDGVYWSGSVYWTSSVASDILFFDVDRESLGKIVMPDVVDGREKKRMCYFGESCDHLHVVMMSYIESTLFVYEMKRDRLGWFVKYRFNLKPVVDVYPGMATEYVPGRMFYNFTMLSLVRGVKDCALLVAKILNKVVLFNLEHHSFKEIHEFADGEDVASRGFEYIESIHSF